MDISTYFPIWKKLNINEQHTLSASVRELHHNRGDLIRRAVTVRGLFSSLRVNSVLTQFPKMAERLPYTAYLSGIFVFSRRPV